MNEDCVEDAACAPHLELGRSGEEIAARYLEKKGWTILERNWRTSRGELDLIAHREHVYPDGALAHWLIVVEVKAKSARHQRSIRPESSVTYKKRRQIVGLAREYMSGCGVVDVVVRFDVIAVVFGAQEPEVVHHEGAFDAQGRLR